MIRRLALSLVLAAATATTATSPAAAAPAAASPPASPVRVAFTVDTSEVGDEGPVIKRRIDERGAVLLRELEVLPARNDDDPRLIVTVHQDRDDGFNFTFEIALVDDDGEVRLDARGECVQCTESVLTERVMGTLRTAIVRLHELEKAPAAAPVEGPEPLPELPIEPAPQRGLSRAGKAGVGLTTVGFCGVGAGIGLLVNPIRPRADNPLQTINTHPPGAAILAVGAAAAVTGAILLIIDHTRGRRRDAERGARRKAERSVAKHDPWGEPARLGDQR